MFFMTCPDVFSGTILHYYYNSFVASHSCTSCSLLSIAIYQAYSIITMLKQHYGLLHKDMEYKSATQPQMHNDLQTGSTKVRSLGRTRPEKNRDRA